MQIYAFQKSISMTLINYFLTYDREMNTEIRFTNKIFSNDVKENISSNLEVLESDFRSNLMTIHQYFY